MSDQRTNGAQPDAYQAGYEHYLRQREKKWPRELHPTWDEMCGDEQACWRAGFEEYAERRLAEMTAASQAPRFWACPEWIPCSDPTAPDFMTTKPFDWQRTEPTVRKYPNANPFNSLALVRTWAEVGGVSTDDQRESLAFHVAVLTDALQAPHPADVRALNAVTFTYQDQTIRVVNSADVNAIERVMEAVRAEGYVSALESNERTCRDVANGWSGQECVAGGKECAELIGEAIKLAGGTPEKHDYDACRDYLEAEVERAINKERAECCLEIRNHAEMVAKNLTGMPAGEMDRAAIELRWIADVIEFGDPCRGEAQADEYSPEDIALVGDETIARVEAAAKSIGMTPEAREASAAGPEVSGGEIDEDGCVSDAPIDVDVEGHLQWLETGSGEPWPASRTLVIRTTSPSAHHQTHADVPDVCPGVIPNTFIACGEGGNYCSDKCQTEGDEAIVDRLVTEAQNKRAARRVEFQELVSEIGDLPTSVLAQAVPYKPREYSPEDVALVGEETVARMEAAAASLKLTPEAAEAFASGPDFTGGECEDAIPDLVDELVAERTKGNPEFPKMVAETAQARVIECGQGACAAGACDVHRRESPRTSWKEGLTLEQQVEQLEGENAEWLAELVDARRRLEALQRMTDGRMGVPEWPPVQHGSITKEGVINRLCCLLYDVWEHFDPNAREPNDCFCGENEVSTGMRFQNAGRALKWVESLVSAALTAMPTISNGEGQ